MWLLCWRIPDTMTTSSHIWVRAQRLDRPHAEHPTPCRTTLPPYHFGNLHWACAHVAAFAGAVLGGAGTWAYAVRGKLDHHPNSKGVHDWVVSARKLHLVLWGAFFLG